MSKFWINAIAATVVIVIMGGTLAAFGWAAWWFVQFIREGQWLYAFLLFLILAFAAHLIQRSINRE